MTFFAGYALISLLIAFGFLMWAIADDIKRGEYMNMRNPVLLLGIFMLATPIMNIFLFYIIYKLATR